MFKIVKLIILLLAAYGVYALWPEAELTVDVYSVTDFEHHPDGKVGFPSFNAMSGMEIQAGGNESVQQTSGGILVLPELASSENKVPAVVILHGSGGEWSGRSLYLANRLARHGIAALSIETFQARELNYSDSYTDRLNKAPIFTQIADGAMALKALQNHPFIHGDKIAVTGFSLGAASALYLMFEPVLENILGKEGPRFSAYASFYAGCSFDFEDFRPEGSPVLIMMGEKDESMSVKRCQSFRKKLKSYNIHSSLIVYPGAAHGWELPKPMAFDEGAWVTKDCEMKWMKDGQTIEQTTGQSMDSKLGAIRALLGCADQSGYTMGEHRPTKEQSWIDFHSFLIKTWQKQEE
ncbi:dienelactone hydrolase family protein [Temperatibacter marinus]|uniref:Dienelactone hydrolase family protein n=1 Tax=Temperatibacter marinus TaxID=1456591 RepID=A0AA52EJ84_9PROT|nr:dienelactone hydrolase family protein [Temperatibacter marinus]WND03514.1 dienelactone hydrolase family protein [Temperatibacter marinus]